MVKADKEMPKLKKDLKPAKKASVKKVIAKSINKEVAKSTKKGIAPKKEKTLHPIKHILVSQPRPENEKSPYFELEKKYNIKLSFHQFIKLEPYSSREFRKQKIELSEYSGIIFNSRNAIDHFFRICEEMKFKISPEMRYFCITEAVALYLQKFIIYRKRKVFFGADGSIDGLMDILAKYNHIKYLIPVAERTKNDISPALSNNGYDYTEGVVYRTVPNEMEAVVKNKDYDSIIFFSPFGLDSIMETDSKFKQKKLVLGAFGLGTQKALEDKGFTVAIKAPLPGTPSMSSAIEKYLEENNK
ncbi:MAG TPA: uroporphyrinogen-III synthase [Edaphocola sp.]|nr:uroporphyrinogen-III synthase [Edaphocola sp.]